jgi:hypothetical protein
VSFDEGFDTMEETDSDAFFLIKGRLKVIAAFEMIMK